MSLESIIVKREGARGWHRIDKDKYDADPSAYVVCDENGVPLSGKAAPRMQGTPEELGEMTDDQLREAIEAATGTAPHPRTGRKKLLDQFNALNVEETASNGLTRREIEADLTGMEVDFDPADALEDLAALRDLSREARG